MPLLITYQGRAVKRRRRVTGGILLTMYSARLNEPGLQILATEQDWQRHGRVQFIPPSEFPDKRALADGLDQQEHHAVHAQHHAGSRT